MLDPILRQIGPNPHHIMRIAIGQYADDCRGRCRVGNTQLANAKDGDPLLSAFFNEAGARQQQVLGILTAHRRTLSNIIAATREFKAEHIVDRLTVNTDVNGQYRRLAIAGQHAHPGHPLLHIDGLKPGHHFRRHGHTFIKYAMVGAHDDNLFLQIIEPVDSPHSRKLYSQALQPTEAVCRLY